jgi:hypothetical protein
MADSRYTRVVAFQRQCRCTVAGAINGGVYALRDSIGPSNLNESSVPKKRSSEASLVSNYEASGLREACATRTILSLWRASLASFAGARHPRSPSPSVCPAARYWHGGELYLVTRERRASLVPAHSEFVRGKIDKSQLTLGEPQEPRSSHVIGGYQSYPTWCRPIRLRSTSSATAPHAVP